jgi:hypothetical protein
MVGEFDLEFEQLLLPQIKQSPMLELFRINPVKEFLKVLGVLTQFLRQGLNKLGAMLWVGILHHHGQIIPEAKLPIHLFAQPHNPQVGAYQIVPAGPHRQMVHGIIDGESRYQQANDDYRPGAAK